MKFKVGDKLKFFLINEQLRELKSKAMGYNIEWYPYWIRLALEVEY